MGRAGIGYGAELGGAGSLHSEGAAGEAALGGKPLLLCKILQWIPTGALICMGKKVSWEEMAVDLGVTSNVCPLYGAQPHPFSLCLFAPSLQSLAAQTLMCENGCNQRRCAPLPKLNTSTYVYIVVFI